MTASARRPGPKSAVADSPAIELVNAARWYGNVVAVNDISFSPRSPE